LKSGTVSGYTKRQLHHIDFFFVFVAITVDGGTVTAAVVVAHPMSVYGMP
jgi:hypothetical protein